MKRYAVFSGMVYYPSGGWGDFIEAFETFQEAMLKKEALTSGSTAYDWAEVVDLLNLEVLDREETAP